MRIRKELEKLLPSPDESSKATTALLNDLRKMNMTLKLLLKTKIGFTVNNIRKSSSDGMIKSYAKAVLKQWQKLENTKEDKKAKDKKTEKKQPGETGLSEIPRPFDVESPEPSVDKAGVLVFPDHPEFRPNLSPQQVLEMGSFGGTYFRPIYSSVTKQKYGKEVWQVSSTRRSESGHHPIL